MIKNVNLAAFEKGIRGLKFKTEVCLLLAAISLFVVSVFFYSYQGAVSESAAFSAALASYPYRGIALMFVGCGSLLTVTASISYTKKNKNLIQ